MAGQLNSHTDKSVSCPVRTLDQRANPRETNMKGKMLTLTGRFPDALITKDALITEEKNLIKWTPLILQTSIHENTLLSMWKVRAENVFHTHPQTDSHRALKDHQPVRSGDDPRGGHTEDPAASPNGGDES